MQLDNYGEILIYQSEDGLTNIEVKMQNETVWLSQQQMADCAPRRRADSLAGGKPVWKGLTSHQ